MIDARNVTLALFLLVIIGYGVYQSWKEWKAEKHYISSTSALNVFILVIGVTLFFAQLLELIWFLSGGQDPFDGILILAVLWLCVTLFKHNPFK